MSSQWIDVPSLSGGGGGGGSGTVTSVGMAVPSALLAVTGSPITTAGVLTVTLTTQTANKVFASPNGSTGTPSFRALVAADIPTLNQNTTGTAANITATSNNTLTSLPSLVLPGSQVSGNISGTASNITATSNNTLTTLSSLTLPGSQVSGNISGTASNVTETVAIANGGTGQTTASGALNAILPTQTGNAGKALITDGTSASWGAENPLASISTVSTFFCDMDGDPRQFGFGSVTTNGGLNFNTYPWTGDTTSIGVISMNTIASSAWYFLTQVTNNTFGSQNLVNKQLTFVGRLALSVVPDAVTANTINMVGFGNVNGSATTEHSNGIYFYASNASPNWICKSAKGGVRTSTDSGVAITTNMVSFSFVATTTQVLFYINNALVATHTTNIPSAVTDTIAMQASIQSQALNYSGTKSIYLDYLGSRTILLTGSR